MKGLACGADDETCARLGSVAATYALEHLGGQSHAYTWEEFVRRYEDHFGVLTLPSRREAPTARGRAGVGPGTDSGPRR